jgi:hypothetical protein
VKRLRIANSTRARRFWTLLLSGIGVLAMVLLAGGLAEMELIPGRPFSLGRGTPSERGALGAPANVETLFVLFGVSFALAWVLLPVAIVLLIISPKFRKQVLRGIVSLVVFMALAYMLAFGLAERSQENDKGLMPGGLSLPGQLSSLPTAEFDAEPPRWLVLAASLGVALLLAALLVWGGRFVWHRLYRPPDPVERLARQAKSALDSLRIGVDLENVVVRCYVEMARILNERRGIERQRHMTAREFETRLEEAGFPGEPVRQLTRLFEQVRYGAKALGAPEERQAIACLTAIVKASSNGLQEMEAMAPVASGAVSE